VLKPWDLHEKDGRPRVPYWLRHRDPAIEREHLRVMRKFEREEKRSERRLLAGR
jgi:hypothetical protein